MAFASAWRLARLVAGVFLQDLLKQGCFKKSPQGCARGVSCKNTPGAGWAAPI